MLEARIVREAQNTDRPLLILFQSYTKHLPNFSAIYLFLLSSPQGEYNLCNPMFAL